MAARVQWMWADSSILTGPAVVRLNPLRWSTPCEAARAAQELQDQADSGLALGPGRPVCVHVKESPETGGDEERELVCEGGPGEAARALRDAEAAGSSCCEALDALRLRLAEGRRHRAEAAPAWPPGCPAERCRQCVECASPAGGSCEVCGLALCAQPRAPVPRCLLDMPLSSGSRAPGRLRACRRCAPLAQARAEARGAVRGAVRVGFRACLAAERMDTALLAWPAPHELASDCAGCGLAFVTGLPGSMRHHCRACGASLCSACLCGSVTCMGSGFCTHKAKLPLYDYDREEKTCRECLPAARARLAARDAWSALASTARRNADHAFRVADFLDDPSSFPFYEQCYVDTSKDKLVRVGGLAVDGAKLLTPFVSTGAAFGINAVDYLRKYGQYGLVGLFFNGEIAESISTLRQMSSTLGEIDGRELLVGLLYLSAEQRQAFRSAPGSRHREALAAGRPTSAERLELLLGLAGIGIRAPYEESAFEVQRLAVQQDWRLVTERLHESWKHRPAWCLYIHKEGNVACIAVRGTDPDKSLGGDIFTDLNALPERAVGSRGVELWAHSGMLAAARALEPELRQALRVLVARGCQALLVGHSLGAGVVALLMWLLRHGADGEQLPAGAQVFGVGYATPAVMDLRSAKDLQCCFTSVVNSVDVVPRLTAASLAELAGDIAKCARESMPDLDQDVQAYVDHAASVFAPKLRTGTEAQPHSAAAVAPDEAAEKRPSHKVHDWMRRLSRSATSSVEGFVAARQPPKEDAEEGPMPLSAFMGRYENNDRDNGGTPRCVDVAAGNSHDTLLWSAPGGARWTLTRTSDPYLFSVGPECPHQDYQAARFVPNGIQVVAALGPGNELFQKHLQVADHGGASGAAAGPAEGTTTPTSPAQSENDKTRMLEAKEGAKLWIAGGPGSVLAAWYGDAARPWQCTEGVGKQCTEEVKAMLCTRNTLVAGGESLGDPCPRCRKRLLVLVKADEYVQLFCPGQIVWIYGDCGAMRAADVPCDAPVMRRVICDKRMMKDHMARSYHGALVAVKAARSASREVPWQPFSEAGDACPCCHSRYDWNSTSRSKKQRSLSMTNCRACGMVVCTSCAGTRQALQDVGIVDPARICDRCAWRGPSAGAVLRALPHVFGGPPAP